jgi:hypothetical protein
VSKNREALIEVSSDGDSLLSFRAEGEQTLEVAVRTAPRAGVLVHRRVRASRRGARSGWADGLLLFVSGLIAGALVAVLSSEWPEGTPEAVVSGESPSNGAENAAAAHATSATALPVGTSSPATSTASPSVARSAETPAIARRSPGFRGTLMVNSQPRGASIFLNDRLVGRTPLRIGALPAGSRAVRLRLDGYQPWSRGVNIVANQSTTVSARLTPDKTSR